MMQTTIMRLRKACFPRLFLFVFVSLFAACGGEDLRPDELASRAAKEYYDHLVAGRYAEYLDGMSRYDSIPVSYREQLLTNAKQFMSRQRTEHKGISSVQVARAVADTTGTTADVFLIVCFGDSVKEEIVIPMVEKGGRWMMR